MTDSKQAFKSLAPDTVLDAVESLGYHCDGRLLALNSYENRVYQVGTEDGPPIVAKFYRPERWSNEAILEEHRFTQGLAEQEIPVIAPQTDTSGRTLFTQGPFRLAIYPCHGGRAPELDNPEHLKQMGRFIARLHRYGQAQSFHARPQLDIDTFGHWSRNYLLDSGLLPPELVSAYDSLTAELLHQIQASYERAGAVRVFPLHGDCHAGNILWTDDGPHVVDFDDARTGPAVQDIWMFLSGDKTYQAERLKDVLEGYTQFNDFNPAELHLVEALRTLRMMHYAAWLAMRWDDPAFPIAFPWFNEQRYWEDHILSLREQSALLSEPPLEWHQ